MKWNDDKRRRPHRSSRALRALLLVSVMGWVVSSGGADEPRPYDQGTVGGGVRPEWSIHVRAAHPLVAKGEEIRRSFVQVDLTPRPDNSIGGAPTKGPAGAETTDDARPVNLAIVVDRSATMRGQRLKSACAAVEQAVGWLGEEDVVAVVVYESAIQVLQPAARKPDLDRLREALRRLEARGHSNLFGGVVRGAAELRRFVSSERVSRVLLLSDGKATIGPGTPQALGELGAALRKEGIAVSTIGLGLDYNEDLMAELAFRSQGNHYFVERPADLAATFEEELEQLRNTASAGVVVQLRFAPGVEPRRSLGFPVDIHDGRVTADLGQIPRQQVTTLLLEVEIDPGEVESGREILEVEWARVPRSVVDSRRGYGYLPEAEKRVDRAEENPAALRYRQAGDIQPQPQQSQPLSDSQAQAQATPDAERSYSENSEQESGEALTARELARSPRTQEPLVEEVPQRSEGVVTPESRAVPEAAPEPEAAPGLARESGDTTGSAALNAQVDEAEAMELQAGSPEDDATQARASERRVRSRPNQVADLADHVVGDPGRDQDLRPDEAADAVSLEAVGGAPAAEASGEFAASAPAAAPASAPASRLWLVESEQQVEVGADIGVLALAMEQLARERADRAIDLRDAGEVRQAEELLLLNSDQLEEFSTNNNISRLREQAAQQRVDAGKVNATGEEWGRFRKQLRERNLKVARQGWYGDEDQPDTPEADALADEVSDVSADEAESAGSAGEIESAP